MINTGKCPKCEKVIYDVSVEDIVLKVGFQRAWKGFSYLCPHCKTIISIQMNPLTLNDDLKNNVLNSLKK